jgi:hypothetical protein
VKRLLALGVFFLWVVLAGALQLLLVGGTGGPGADGPAYLRACVPDLMTLVLVSAVGRLDRRDVVLLAAVAATARAACSASPPFALLAGCVTVALIADTIRRFADLERPWLRAAAAGAGALLLGLWLLLVDLLREGGARATSAMSFGSVSEADLALPLLTAAMTAAAAPVVWPALHRLPGLRRLERRRF